MASAVGPRLGGHRAPVSLTNEEILAVAGYRSALRQLRLATANERKVVEENRSKTALVMADNQTRACVDAYSAALATLNAVLGEGEGTPAGARSAATLKARVNALEALERVAREVLLDSYDPILARGALLAALVNIDATEAPKTG